MVFLFVYTGGFTISLGNLNFKCYFVIFVKFYVI